MRYLFGDSDIAARRLKIVAEVFAETTRAFLLEAVTNRPGLCVDLGCGPGYSTHFLAEVLECKHTVGLDNSENFISLAQKTKTEKVSFYLHDVTSIQFPIGPADLIYCRFLLTHLKDPLDAVFKWATQLQPKGLLLIEELDWIHTKNTVFRAYLEIVETMLEHQSNKLYVGRLLNSLEDTDILKRRKGQVRHLQDSNHKAANMFFLNVQSWKQQPFIRTNYSSVTINQLEEELKILTKKRSSETEIEWGLRQLVFERV